MVVSRTRIIVVICAVLLWAAMPVVACLMPCLAPAQAKQECFDQMAMPCEHSVMPASDQCCQAASGPEAAMIQGQATQSLKHALVAVPVSVRISLPDVLARQLASLAFFESPPAEAPPLSSSVLRI